MRQTLCCRQCGVGHTKMVEAVVSEEPKVEPHEELEMLDKSVGEGDVVCVLGGGRTPFVLRVIEGTVDGYKLVGVCYVYGIMNGEWILKHRSVEAKRFRPW